jgi:hypothetical protein
MANVAAALRARKERRENRCGAFMTNTSPILAFVVAGRFPFFPSGDGRRRTIAIRSPETIVTG